MTIIKGIKMEILSIIALALLLVNENAVEVDCEPHFNEENTLQNPENLFGLIFTEENQINIFNPNDENLIKLATSSKPQNPIFSCKRKTLYWIDESSKILAREFSHSPSTKIIFKDKSLGIEALALDHTTDKLYIGNTVFHTIEVVDLKTGNHGIVRSQTLPRIFSITIDLNERYMFILGPRELIRMDLDGSNFQYISQEPMSDPGSRQLAFMLFGPFSSMHEYYINTDPALYNFVALDLIEKRVYWMNVEEMDATNATIWSSTYDGKDQKFHLRLETGPQFITENHCDLPIYSPMGFLSNMPYWVDNNQGVIRRINLDNVNDSEVIYQGTPKKMVSITSINCDLTDQTPVTNPCDQENGGCQHLCILSRTSKINYRCFCNVGYELAEDGKSCILPTKFIMFNQNEFVRGISWREDTKQYIDVLRPLKQFPGSEGFLDVNIEDGVMYRVSNPFSEKRRSDSQILSVDLNNTKNMILKPNFLDRRVSHIAFDWASKNLYYISNYYDRESLLCVLNVKNPTYSKILARKNHLLSLAVHPDRGYVFFTEIKDSYDYNATLTRIHTDGSNSISLLENRNVTIRSITIDYNEDKVYWVEIRWLIDEAMYCSNLDGTNIMKVDAQFLGDPRITFMVIHGDWIYLTRNASYSLERVPKTGGKSEPLITADVPDFKIFDPSIQTVKSDHPCTGSKNSCDKFCFAVPNKEKSVGLERVCGCPYGEKLADNGISCVDNSKEQPALARCYFESFYCMKEHVFDSIKIP